MNSRISKKERGLLKGAIRRVFSRSEVRRAVVEASRIVYTDPKRPRVTKWSMCSACKQPTPTYLIQIDHIEPIIGTDESMEEISWDELVNRIWCEETNLTPVCKPCHTLKTKAENALRRKHKKEMSSGKK
jgi:hypothetical protein